MITKAQALEIAKQECTKRGWQWNEPVSVNWGLFCYTVWGGGRKGGNICVKVKKSNGEVISVGISPQ